VSATDAVVRLGAMLGERPYGTEQRPSLATTVNQILVARWLSDEVTAIRRLVRVYGEADPRPTAEWLLIVQVYTWAARQPGLVPPADAVELPAALAPWNVARDALGALTTAWTRVAACTRCGTLHGSSAKCPSSK
jgi:hypothetical protein